MAEELWDMTTTGYGPSAMIETTEGVVPIKWLSTTHKVITRDNGAQPILTIEQHILHPLDGAYVPLVSIDPPEGSDDHPLILPPKHQILLDGPEIGLNFGFKTGLCQAGFMVGSDGVTPFNSGAPIAFYTVLTPAHEMIRASGHWVETYAVKPGSPLSDLESLSPDIFARLDLVDGAHAPPYPSLTEWEGRLVACGRLTTTGITFKDVA